MNNYTILGTQPNKDSDSLDLIIKINENDLVSSHVKKWSRERKINTSDPYKQFLKVMEELGELSEAMAKNKPVDIVDGFGDVLVTLEILNQQLNERKVIDQDLHSCYKIAYEEIKNRKGKMINGLFVKESDLGGD